MKVLAKYWKVLLVVILLGLAAFLYIDKYQTAEAEYETKTQQLETMILAMEKSIQENMKYAGIQDQLDDAKAELEASRLELYKNFPVEMKEEDQIMYALYLETLFGTEINLEEVRYMDKTLQGMVSQGTNFHFGDVQLLAPLQDDSNLVGLILPINYETTYKGFQDIVNYLATDSRIVSIYNASILYDAEKDVAKGVLYLVIYMMESEVQEYLPPDVAIPDTGKDNIFE